MLTPLDFDLTKIKPTSNKSATLEAQPFSPKSVSFVLDSFSASPRKGKEPSFSGMGFPDYHEPPPNNKMSIFHKRNRCKTIMQTTEIAKVPVIATNEGPSFKESPLNITDSFQYRIEGLLEEEDLTLDITPLKKRFAKRDEKPLLTLNFKKLSKNNQEVVTLVKSNMMMRRKSDSSKWGGGIAALDKKTFFMTFEYIEKVTKKTPKPSARETQKSFSSKDTENTRYRKMVSSVKLDTGSLTPTRKALQQAKINHWTTMTLDVKKEGGEEKNIEKESPYLLFPTRLKKASFFVAIGDETGKSDRRCEGSFGKYFEALKGSTSSVTKIKDVPKEVEPEIKLTIPSTNKRKIPEYSLKIPQSDLLGLKKDIKQSDSAHMSSARIQRSKIHRSIQISSSTMGKERSPLKTSRTPEKSNTSYLALKRHVQNFSGDFVSNTQMSYTRNESWFAKGGELSRRQENSNDRTSTEDKGKNQDNSDYGKRNIFSRLHKNLIAKVYNHERKTQDVEDYKISLIKGKDRDSQSFKKEKNFLLPNISTTRSDRAQLLKLNLSTSKMSNSALLTTSNKNKGNLSAFRPTGKAEIRGLEELSTSREIDLNVIKSLKREKSEKIMKKTRKFKPKISNTKQLIANYSTMKF